MAWLVKPWARRASTSVSGSACNKRPQAKAKDGMIDGNENADGSHKLVSLWDVRLGRGDAAQHQVVKK